MCRSPQNGAGLENGDVITMVAFKSIKSYSFHYRGRRSNSTFREYTHVCIQVYKTETVRESKKQTILHFWPSIIMKLGRRLLRTGKAGSSHDAGSLGTWAETSTTDSHLQHFLVLLHKPEKKHHFAKSASTQLCPGFLNSKKEGNVSRMKD